ncbi:hypothetical protein [Xanthomonas campestris]|uniref:hypothetical protein n=1 Tax=Xanthomonas campestris TaxID=339 RepID=UPI002006E5AA|nr:hypothetical protein [Xanthomonas campestris]
MRVDLEGDAGWRVDGGQAQRFMQACRWRGAWMRKQDVDRNVGAGIGADGGSVVPLAGNSGDAAIDHGHVAACQIGA